MMKKVRNILSAAALLLLILALAVGASGCGLLKAEEEAPEQEIVEEETDPSRFVSGTMMDSVDISGMNLEEALEACRAAVAQKFEHVQVTLQITEEISMDLTAEDIVIADTLDYALSNLLKSREPGQNEINYHLRAPELESELNTRSAEFNVEGQDASIDHYDYEKKEFVFTESVDGLVLDTKETVQAVLDQFKCRNSGTVQAVMVEAPAAVTTEALKESMALISEYTTKSTNSSNGDHNMGLALSRVDGTVLNPGELFSFEAKVGDSTNAASGFKPANGLMNGILVPMYGGGICQASTTIYGAALRAGMTIVDRGSHSVPSTYVPIGQDAAVSYRSLDFKFKNDLDTPVYIMAWMEGKDLFVRFYGKKPTEWDSIEVYSKQTGTLARLEKVTYEVDDKLQKDEIVEVSKGNYGYTAEAWRDYIKDGEVIKTEALPSSYYRPTGPTYKVGPGTDTSTNPVPGASPSPEASPSPDTSATPDPTEPPVTQEPTVTPEPTPEVTVTPAPTPIPEPTPEPAPAPELPEPGMDITPDE